MTFNSLDALTSTIDAVDQQSINQRRLNPLVGGKSKSAISPPIAPLCSSEDGNVGNKENLSTRDFSYSDTSRNIDANDGLDIVGVKVEQRKNSLVGEDIELNNKLESEKVTERQRNKRKRMSKVNNDIFCFHSTNICCIEGQSSI